MLAKFYKKIEISFNVICRFIIRSFTFKCFSFGEVEIKDTSTEIITLPSLSIYTVKLV